LVSKRSFLHQTKNFPVLPRLGRKRVPLDELNKVKGRKREGLRVGRGFLSAAHSPGPELISRTGDWRKPKDAFFWLKGGGGMDNPKKRGGGNKKGTQTLPTGGSMNPGRASNKAVAKHGKRL